MASVPPTKPDRTGPLPEPREPLAEPFISDSPETEPASPDFGEPAASPDKVPGEIDEPEPLDDLAAMI
ncbi:hypothetical protein GCM10011515_21660 [Tsuneonella deserti]|uniref:Uncharacterized protein n=1 Tax=Tsuneonella deserti TaxID=2035528 RepID=A0ABQ1SCR3_9SPHN|nr:hypothetical protein [Tsuneonella deserti]GGE01602.1 hypothetical protein GCM10011515_21660 [Tsuneonella deserti]